MWWLYYEKSAVAAAEVLQRIQGASRDRLAVNAYSLVHFPLVIGVLYIALGMEQVPDQRDPQPGNRIDTIVYRSSGIDQTLDGRPVMADSGYRGNPEVIMPYRKPSDGSSLPGWKEALNVEHRGVRAGVEHALARMKNFKILRDYRRAGHTLADAASGIAKLHNIIPAG